MQMMRYEPLRTIADTFCGTSGFFVGCYGYLTTHHRLDREQKAFLKYRTFKGWAIVPRTARLYSMNLLLHNIGDINAEPPVQVQNILISDPGDRLDYLLSNPPFGKESSITLNTGASKTGHCYISSQSGFPQKGGGEKKIRQVKIYGIPSGAAVTRVTRRYLASLIREKTFCFSLAPPPTKSRSQKYAEALVKTPTIVLPSPE